MISRNSPVTHSLVAVAVFFLCCLSLALLATQLSASLPSTSIQSWASEWWYGDPSQATLVSLSPSLPKVSGNCSSGRPDCVHCKCPPDMTSCVCTPSLAIDALLELFDGSDHFLGLVMVERGHYPFGMAFPGGFVEVGEHPEQTVVREVMEETGLQATQLRLFGTYSTPGRDPRRHTVSVMYLCRAYGTPKAGDDAKKARILPIDQLASYSYAFDHNRVIADYLRYKAQEASVNATRAQAPQGQ